MFKRKFKEEFDFHGFISFVRDIFDNYGFGEIRFFPKDHKDIFTYQQLRHVSPSWTVDDPYGFVSVWKKNKDIVRIVVFDQFSKFESEKRRIRITIDLDKKFISLDEVRGLFPEEVGKVLENSFGPNLISEGQNNQVEKSTGILSKGKSANLINNTILGYDVGIQDEGEDTLALGNKILGKLPSVGKIEIIGRDKIEQHGDKNKASIENKKPEKESFLSKIFWNFFITIVVGLLIGYLVLKFGWK